MSSTLKVLFILSSAFIVFIVLGILNYYLSSFQQKVSLVEFLTDFFIYGVDFMFIFAVSWSFLYILFLGLQKVYNKLFN